MRMSDLDDRPAVVRIVAVALTAVVVVPAVLLYGYLLLYFLPEATGYRCEDGEPGCRYEPTDTVYWWLLLTIVVVAVVALVLSWWRRWHADPWWLWPVLALAAVAVGFAVSTLLV